MTRAHASSPSPLALRAEPIFSHALTLPLAEQSAYLRDACAGDEPLREYVARLLAAHATAGLSVATPGAPAATPLDADHDPMIGRTLGEFRIARLIGVGGMGTVYEAEQAVPHRTVALKVMRLALAAAGGAQRFRIETEVLAQLEHPGIARIYAVGVASLESGKVPYFAMELVRGVPLDQHVRARSPDAPDVLRLVADVCDAIDYAHRRGVVHRDLKPGNVLVTDSGQVKILDFGVARSTGDLQLTSQTTAGQIIGTLQYMSPEQALGDARAADPRSDVYALGVILYELLAGARPYDVADLPLAAAAESIRNHEPPRLGIARPALAGDIETIVAKAMEKQADRRYQSAAELAEDIRRHLRHDPILARPATTLYKITKFVRRNRAVSVGVLIAFLALSAGFTATSLALRRAVREKADADKARSAESAAAAEATRQSDEASFRAYVANLAAADGAIAQDDVDAAIFHLQQCPEDLRQWEWRYLHSRLDQSVRTFEPPDGPEKRRPDATVWGMTLTPDARRLFICRDAQIWAWDLDSDRPARRIADFRGRYASTQEIDVTRDGARLVAAQSWDRAATVIDAVSGAELLTLRGHSDELHSPTFSPDGTLLATGSFDGSAIVWDLATGTPLHTFATHSGHVRSVAFTSDGARLVVTGTDGPPSVWSIADGRLLARAELTGGNCWISVISPDATRALSTNSQGFAWVWDLATGRTIRLLQGHRGVVCGVAWSPDGRTLATGGEDRSIRLWDAASGIQTAKLRGNARQVDFLQFSHDSARIFASGHWSPSVKEWPAREVSEPLLVHAHFGDLNELRISPDSSLLLTTGRDRVLRVHDAVTGESIAALRGHLEPSAVVPTPDWRRWIALDRFGRRELWDPGAWRVLATGAPAFPDGRILRLAAISPEGLLIARAGGPDELALDSWAWCPPDSPREPWTTSASDARATLGLADDGSMCSSADRATGLVRVISRTSPDPVIEVPTPGEGGSPFVTSDPPRLFVGTPQGIDVYDLASKRQIGRMDAYGANVHRVRYTPDRRRILTTHSDGRIRLWDAARLKLVFTLLHSQNWVYDAQMTPSGDRIVSIDSSGDIAIWETTTRPARVEFEAAAAARDASVLAAVAAALGASRDPQDAADRLQADASLAPDVRATAARRARSHPGTVEGSIDWCWAVIADPDAPDHEVLWANDAAVSIRRIARSEAMLSAISAAAHLRRTEKADASTRAELLRIAARRLEQARSACRDDDLPTRSAVLAAEILAALAAGRNDDALKARRSLLDLGAPDIAGPAGLRRFLAEAIAAGAR